MEADRFVFRFSVVIAVFLFAITATVHSAPSLRNPAPAKGGSKSSTGLTVAHFTPSGAIQGNEVIEVTFSNDVTTSEAIQSGEAPRGIFSFDPNIEGLENWENTKTVRYIPRTAMLRQATAFTVRINPLLRDVNNAAIKGPLEFHFNTPPPELQKAEQVGFNRNQGATIRLTFSDKVQPAALSKYVIMKNDGNVIHWKPESNVATAAPRLITDPLSTGSLSVRVMPGLTGIGGPVPMKNSVEMKIPLTMKFMVKELIAGWNRNQPILQLRFSNPVHLAHPQDSIEITPNVPFTINSDGDSNVNLAGPFQPNTRYTVTVKTSLATGNQQSLSQPATLSAWMPPMSPFMELPDQDGYLGTRGSMHLRVVTAAVTTLTVTTRRIFDNNIVMQVIRNNNNEYGARELGTVVSDLVFPVQNKDHGATTTSLDLHQLVGETSSGIYAIHIEAQAAPGFQEGTNRLASNNDDDGPPLYLAQTSVITLSNLGIIGKLESSGIMVWVGHLETAEPIEGVTAQLFSSANQLLAQGQTDAQGILHLNGWNQIDPSHKPAVILCNDHGDVSWLDLRESLSSWPSFETTGRDYPGKNYQAFVTPERGAYRPGETVQLAGFLRDQESKTPATAFPVEMVLTRPDGKALNPVTITPGTSGTLEHRIPIPNWFPTGFYTVDIKTPGSDKTREEGYDDNE